MRDRVNAARKSTYNDDSAHSEIAPRPLRVGFRVPTILRLGALRISVLPRAQSITGGS